MATTIQVKEDTLEWLKRLREQYKAASYDEVIDTLIKKEHTLPKSGYGLLKGKVSRKDMLEGLRDKHDRM